MDHPLAGKAIAILISNGFEEVEMSEAQRALLKLGATLHVISTEQGLVNGWHGKAWGHYFPVDKQIGEVLAADYDMLVLPGGERSIAKLKQTAHTRRIVGSFMDGGKPVAAIDDGVELIAFAERLKGRTVTGKDASREAVEAAGGVWNEDELVEDRVLLTARGPEQIEAFVQAMTRVFIEASGLRDAA